MKIGILTSTLAVNYGAVLQNYALSQILSRLGNFTLTIMAERRIGGGA